MLDSTVNTYDKGLNRDISKTKYNPSSYFDALNIRVVTDESLTSFSISNESSNAMSFRMPSTSAIYRVQFAEDTLGDTTSGGGTGGGMTATAFNINGVSKMFGASAYVSYEALYNALTSAAGYQYWINAGHYRIFNNRTYILIVGLDQPLTVYPTAHMVITRTVPAYSNLKIVKSVQLRQHLILFTTANSGDGQLWRLTVNEDGTIDDIGTSGYLIPSQHLIYNQMLNLNTAYNIDAYANYETPEVGKVYWVDNTNNFRHFNTFDGDSLSVELSATSIVPEVNFGDIRIDSITDTGNYKSGMVQYAYQYYNLHGAQSAFSPATGLIHLTDSSEVLSDTAFYFGAPRDKQSGKAVRLVLSGLDKRFTNIRTVAIFYEAEYGTPEITIIDDRNVPDSASFFIVDSGSQAKGTIAHAVYAALGSLNFKAKTLTTKDNIMFPANITEEFFDVDVSDPNGYWDSRAYRFSGSGRARVYSSDGTYKNIVKSGNNFYYEGTTTPVEQTADVIQSKATQGTYRFLPDGSQYGGEGPNVKYTFKLGTLIEDAAAIPTSDLHYRKPYPTTDFSAYYTENINARQMYGLNNNGYTNYANVKNQANMVGYQRDEVYRFGLVFRDKYGRRSFVKWVADIKMPAMHETDIVTTYFVDGTHKHDFALMYRSNGVAYTNVLYISLELKNGLPNDAVSYEVVRCKRNEWDKTIKAQGLVTGINVEFDDYYRAFTYPRYSSETIAQKTLLFISPEVTFNKRVFEGSAIQPVAGISITAFGSGDHYIDNDVYPGIEGWGVLRLADSRDIIVAEHVWLKAHQYYITNNYNAPVQIVDQRVVAPDAEAIYTVNNVAYKHYRFNETASKAGYPGTALVFGIDTNLTANGLLNEPFDGETAEPKPIYLIANIVNELSAQYGGNAYSDRFANEYISCGQSTNENTVSVFGGDTYINFYDHLYGIFDWPYGMPDENENSCIPIYFPVESTMNLALRHDVCQSKISNAPNTFVMQEKAGTYVTPGNVIFYQETDLYLYNHVYSKDNDVIIYTSKPLNFSENREFDTRILSSEVKHLNEEVDNWTSYLVSNFVDVDGTYGPINKLVTFNQKVLFYQDKALGWASVNERSLITPDATGTSLSLGKGGILDQYFYISRHSGSKHLASIVYTPNGVYSYDVLHNKINVFTGENNNPISELKGLSSYLKNLSIRDLRTNDKPVDGIGVHGVYDNRLNRIIWTFNDLYSPDEFTVSYNEIMQAFESFYSYKPRLYMQFDDKVFSTDPLNQGVAYIHNQPGYGSFYDQVYDSTLEFVVNRDPYRTKIFTNIEYYLNTYPDDMTNFKSIRVKNDYQDTNDVVLSSDNSGRRMRTWRHTIQRNQTGDDRIRGEYALIKLTYDNTNSNKFILSDVITHYLSRSL